MRGDIPQAAFNLLMKLPVRTHEQSETQRREYARNLHNGGAKARRIEVNGVVYKSHGAALTALRIGHPKLMALISSGAARVLG